MNELKTIDDILDFAIQREREAAEFYSRLASQAPSPEMRRTFEEFADEERGHEARLLAAKAGEKFVQADDRIQDLRIADYAVHVEPAPNLDYPESLILAMRREKASFRLYMRLAERTEGEIRELFLALAQEEAKHKVRFEIEYDEEVLVEN